QELQSVDVSSFRPKQELNCSPPACSSQKRRREFLFFPPRPIYVTTQIRGSLVVRASDSRPEGWVRCPIPPNTLHLDAEIVEVEIEVCRHLSSLRELRRAKIVLSPVWCSRPTTGVPLAHAR
ncbi:hypothetical protein TNCV_3548741, partial [Trichonephila clavipes]